MQQYSNTGEGSLSVFLVELVQRHLESVLAANRPESTPEPVKLAGSDVESLIVACCETVKTMAWTFARSSDGHVDIDEMYSIGMLEICEAVAAGRGIHAEEPVVYLCQVARYAMCHEWRRLHECSTDSLDAPLSDNGSFTLYDVFPSPDLAVPPSPTSSKRVHALNGAIRRLASARQRVVLRRRYGMEGYGAHNLGETARALRASKDAAKCLDQRGRHNLARDARLCEVMGVEVE